LYKETKCQTKNITEVKALEEKLANRLQSSADYAGLTVKAQGELRNSAAAAATLLQKQSLKIAEEPRLRH
jgi:hypothetical protein